MGPLSLRNSKFDHEHRFGPGGGVTMSVTPSILEAAQYIRHRKLTYRSQTLPSSCAGCAPVAQDRLAGVPPANWGKRHVGGNQTDIDRSLPYQRLTCGRNRGFDTTGLNQHSTYHDDFHSPRLRRAKADFF